MRKYDIMSMAHRKAKDLKIFGDKRSYRELLSISLKVRYMMKRTITVIDINWLYENLPSKHIDLSLVKSLHITKAFYITGSVRNDADITINNYVKPRTTEQDESLIGALIASEIKSGITLNLD